MSGEKASDGATAVALDAATLSAGGQAKSPPAVGGPPPADLAAAPPALDPKPPPKGGATLFKINAIWWLNLIMAGTTLLLFAGPVNDLEPIAQPHLPWWLLAVAFAVAEISVVHLQFRRSAHSFSLGDIPLVFGLLFAGGNDLMAGILLGTGLVLVLDRRLPLIKLVFNLAQFALGACLGLLVLHDFVAPGTAVDVGTWLITFLATETSALMAVLFITFAISLSEGPIEPGTLGQMLGLDLMVTVANTSVGLAGAVILTFNPQAIPLLIVPVVTVFFAYRAYLTERQRHERLEFLYEATRTLSRSPEIVLALEALLGRSLEAFRAELAEIVLLGSDGSPSLRTTLGPGDQKEVMRPMDETVARDLLELVGNDVPSRRLSRPFQSERLRHYLESRRVTDAMLAVLPGEKRVIGTIMLANRFGVVRSFSDEDLKLFETLASNASVALQYDRLEQAVHQLRELQEQLEHQAYHDPLTELANRSLFANQVKEALEKGTNELAVLFIDVDDFKTVNDGLGHEAGDKLLISVANRLRECVRPTDSVARLGGDEFAVLVEDRVDAQTVAVEVTRRIMSSFERPVSTGEQTASVHMSIGIATTHQSGRRSDELIRDADVAMYQAKAAGKQRYEIFDPPMRSAVLKRHGLKEELRTAVERGELVVQYQPIVELKTGDVVSAEALIRWKHPGRGQLTPAEFVPLAEETGLIVAVGEFVLDAACKQARRWQRRRSSGMPVGIHVNLSAVELQDPWLADRVTAAVTNAGLAPEQLVLEVTESVLVEDADAIMATMQQLRKVGVRLALDDFGTGYSSLNYLRSLPLDILKIAMPFVEGIARGRQENSFVRMIIELATTLGLQVVAEGIETADQLEVLQDLNCELGQGFYLSAPLDASDNVVLPFVSSLPR